MTRLTTLRNLLSPGSTWSLSEKINLPAVYSRNAPNRYSTHENRSMIAMPAKMKIARMTSAPKMPQNNTRCWYFCGTRK